MNPGDVVLIPLPQTGGGLSKIRPALVLSALPGPYQNVLICGISTQMHGLQPGWDEIVETVDPDFAASGLKQRSAIASAICMRRSPETFWARLDESTTPGETV